jgi:hypothetical protein
VPKGPKGQKRHADTAKNAVLVMQIATGEAADEFTNARRAGGLKGGKARAKALPPSKRSEIAKLAASARWKKSR